ncbi:MAG: hypothetical protein PHZ23_15235 [Acidiphilium sp.]|nr:hypothetical protein [Acidiphilium sp.]
MELPPHARRRRLILALSASAAMLAVILGVALMMGGGLSAQITGLIDRRLDGRGGPLAIAPHPRHAVSVADAAARADHGDLHASGSYDVNHDGAHPDATGSAGVERGQGEPARYGSGDRRSGGRRTAEQGSSSAPGPNAVIYGGSRTSDKLKAWEGR